VCQAVGTAGQGGLDVAAVVVYTVVTNALRVLFWAVFLQAVLSWLPSVLDSSAWARGFDRAVRSVAEPFLAPIRRLLPTGAAVDFSPLVFLLLVRVAMWLTGQVLLR